MKSNLVLTTKFVMCSWSAVINENVIFTQIVHKITYTLTVPVEEFIEEELKQITEGHYCGGCKDLPMKGYVNKYSWCDFSRHVANLYNAGYRWVSSDPRKMYTFILSDYDYRSQDIKTLEQTIYTISSRKRDLGKNAKKMRAKLVLKAMEQWNGIGKCPYKDGYIGCPMEVTDALGGEIVLVDDNCRAYSLRVSD